MLARLEPPTAYPRRIAEHLSYCRICVAGCGIVVTVDDGGTVTKVRGDAEHPLSHGYVCSKGRGIPTWHHGERRLDHPRVRGEQVTWDEALDDLAAALAGTIAAGADGSPDPNSVGVYVATGMAYDAAGAVVSSGFARSIGSRTFYSAATVDNAPALVAAELVTGNAMLNPVWSSNEAGLLLLVGNNPVVSHGYGTALPDPIGYLRRFRDRGGRVWVLDPRRSESAALADGHVPVRPGGDVAVLAAVARGLLDAGADPIELRDHCSVEEVDALRAALAPYTVERAATAADVPPDDIRRLLDEIRDHPGRLSVYAGTGAMMSADGVLIEWLRWVLLILTGSLDRPGGGMQLHHGLGPPLRPIDPNRPPPPGPASRPDLPRVARQLPVLALVDEIEAGNLRALVVSGGNPIYACPEPDRMRAALARLDALVVIDVQDGELCELATHVLPATGQLERADLTTYVQFSMERSLQYSPAIVAPVGDRRPVWWILGHLSRRLGGDVLGGADPDELSDEDYLRGMLAGSGLDADRVVTNGPRGEALPKETGWVRTRFLRDGRWNVAPASLIARLRDHEAPGPGLLLTPRREMGWSNSVRYGGRGAEPIVRMHPDDVEAAGVDDDGPAVLASAHGSVEVRVHIDRNTRRGVVSMTHGRRGTSPGTLLSRRDGVDPLTAMPHASGVPVTVVPSGAPPPDA